MKKLHLIILMLLVAISLQGQILQKPTGTVQACDSQYYRVRLTAATDTLYFKSTRKAMQQVLHSNMAFVSNTQTGGVQLIKFFNTTNEDTLWFSYRTSCGAADSIETIRDTVQVGTSKYPNAYTLNILKFESFNTPSLTVQRNINFFVETDYKLLKGKLAGIAIVKQVKTNGLVKNNSSSIVQLNGININPANIKRTSTATHYIDTIYLNNNPMNTGDTLKVKNSYQAVCEPTFNNGAVRQIFTEFSYYCKPQEASLAGCAKILNNQSTITLNSFSKLNNIFIRKNPADTCIGISRQFTIKFFNSGNETAYNPRFVFTRESRYIQGLIDSSSIQITLPDSSQYLYKNIVVDKVVNYCKTQVTNPIRVAFNVNVSPDTNTYSNFILDKLLPRDTVTIRFTVTRCCTEDMDFENMYYNAATTTSPSTVPDLIGYNSFTDGGYGVWGIYDNNQCGTNNCKPISTAAYHFPNNPSAQNTCQLENRVVDWGATAGIMRLNQTDNKVRSYIMGRGFETDTFRISTSDFFDGLAFVNKSNFKIKIRVLTQTGLRHRAGLPFVLTNAAGERWVASTTPIMIDCDTNLIPKGYAHSVEAVFDKSTFPYSSPTPAMIASFFTESETGVGLEAYCISLDGTGRNCPAIYPQKAMSKYTFQTFISYGGCDTCFVPMAQTGDSVFVNCPGCEIPGTIIAGNTVQRKTIGEQDNNNNGWADNTNFVKANHAKLNLTTALLGDTVDVSVPLSIYNGGMLTLDDLKSMGYNPKYLYMKKTVTNGKYLQLLSSKIFVTKDSITKDSINVTGTNTGICKTQLAGTVQEIMYNISLDTLYKYFGAGGIIDTNKTIGDYQYIIVSKFRVVNHTSTFEPIDCAANDNAFVRVKPQPAASYFTLPTMLEQDTSNFSQINNLGMQCENFGGNIRILMPYFQVGTLSNQFDIISGGNTNSCVNIPQYHIEYRTSKPKRDNFPYEYRRLGYVDTLEFTLPQGYTVQNKLEITWGIKNAANSYTDKLRDYTVVPTVSSNNYKFSIGHLFKKYLNAPLASDTLLPMPDECFVIKIRPYINPVCGMVDTVKKAPVKAYLKQLAYFGDTLVNKRFLIKADPKPVLTVIDSVSKFVETKRFVFDTDLLIQNESTTVPNYYSDNGSRNTFIKLESINKRIVIDTIGIINPSTLVETKIKYPITVATHGLDSIIYAGYLQIFSTTNSNYKKTYRIYGKYVCNSNSSISTQTDSLRIIYGWNCAGYPSNNLAATCLNYIDTAYWELDPRDAGLAMSTKIEYNGQLLDNNVINPCDSVMIRIKINSTSLGKIYGLNSKVKVELPTSLVYRANSSQILLGTNVLSTANPTQSGDTLIWELNNAQLVNGYSSGDSSIYVRAKFATKCSFGQTALIKTKVNAVTYCGGDVNVFDTVSVFILPYNPPVKDSLLVTVNSNSSVSACDTLPLVFTIKNQRNSNTKGDNYLTVFGNNIALPVITGRQTITVTATYHPNGICGNGSFTWNIQNTDTTTCLSTVCYPPYSITSGSINIKTISCSPAPVVSGTSTICNNQTRSFIYTISNQQTNAVYNWALNNGAYTTGNTYTVNNPTSGFTLQVFATDTNGCHSDTSLYTVNVSNFAAIQLGGADSLCVDDNGNYSITNPQANYVYTFVITGATATNITNTSFTVQSVQNNFTIKVWARDKSTNCYSDTISKNVTVNPLPIVSISGSDIVCPTPTVLTFTANPVLSNTSYDWEIGGTHFYTSSITALITQTTTITLVTTANTGCTAYTDKLVTKLDTLPQPEIRVTNEPSRYCLTENYSFIISTVPSGQNVTWTFDAGTTVLTTSPTNRRTVMFTTEGYHRIIASYLYLNSCTITDTISVFVKNCDCFTSDSTLGNRNSVTTFTGGRTFNFSKYIVEGDLVFADGTFTLSKNTTFYVKSGIRNGSYKAVTITLHNAILDIRGATITAACDTMWGGIQMTQNSYIQTNALANAGRLDSTEISYALKGIDIYKQTTGGAYTYSNRYKILNTKFINNRIAVFGLLGYQYAGNTSLIYNSTFKAKEEELKYPYDGVAGTGTIGIVEAYGNYSNVLIRNNVFDGLSVGITTYGYAGSYNIKNNWFYYCKEFAISGFNFGDINAASYIGYNKIFMRNDATNIVSPNGIYVLKKSCTIIGNQITGVGTLSAASKSYGMKVITGSNINIITNKITNTTEALNIFPMVQNGLLKVDKNTFTDNETGFKLHKNGTFLARIPFTCNDFVNSTNNNNYFAGRIDTNAFLSQQGDLIAGPNNTFNGFILGDIINDGNPFDYFTGASDDIPVVVNSGFSRQNAQTTNTCNNTARTTGNNPQNRALGLQDTIRLQIGSEAQLREHQNQLADYYFPMDVVTEIRNPHHLNELEAWLSTLPPCNMEAYINFGLLLYEYYTEQNQPSEAQRWEDNLKQPNVGMPIEIADRIEFIKLMHQPVLDRQRIRDISLNGSSVSATARLLHLMVNPNDLLPHGNNLQESFVNTNCNPSGSRVKQQKQTTENILPEFQNDVLRLIPNPASENVKIIVNFDKYNLQIIEPVTGRIQYQQAENKGEVTINTSQWASGVYLVQVKSRIKEIRQKLVIVK